MHTGNLLGQIPSPLPNEVFTDLVSTNHFRIERILSQGQQTPTGEWFDQDEHEWVALMQGEAILVFITPDTGVQERVHLGPGDYINIPAHLQHRGEWTHPTETTVWLCIYYEGSPFFAVLRHNERSPVDRLGFLGC